MRTTLLAEKKSVSASDEPAWMSDPAIVDILDNGLECQHVEYADFMDRPLQVCWQCLCHDESSNQFRKSDIKSVVATCESNQFRKSDIKSVVATCESFKSRCVGGSGVAKVCFFLSF